MSNDSTTAGPRGGAALSTRWSITFGLRSRARPRPNPRCPSAGGTDRTSRHRHAVTTRTPSARSKYGRDNHRQGNRPDLLRQPRQSLTADHTVTGGRSRRLAARRAGRVPRSYARTHGCGNVLPPTPTASAEPSICDVTEQCYALGSEDLLQTALVKVALRWRQVRDGQPEAYLRTILYRDAVSLWRRHRREVLVADPPDHHGRDDGDERASFGSSSPRRWPRSPRNSGPSRTTRRCAPRQ